MGLGGRACGVCDGRIWDCSEACVWGILWKRLGQEMGGRGVGRVDELEGEERGERGG